MAFQELVDEFLLEEFEASPILGSSLGLTEYDDRLDDLSAETFRRRDADATAWRERFEAVPNGELDIETGIDRDLAIAILRGREILADWATWRRDPQAYTGPILQGVFGLFLHRLRPESELAAAAAARLAEAPRAIEQGMANLSAEHAHPLIVGRGAGAARAGARYLRELLPADVAPGPDRDRLARAGAAAAEALDRWVVFLEDLAARSTGTWRLGEERYSRLLREREALPYDARALREVGQREYDRIDAEMRDIARGIDGTKSCTAASSYPCPRVNAASSSRRPCSNGRCSASRRTPRHRPSRRRCSVTSSSRSRRMAPRTPKWSSGWRPMRGARSPRRRSTRPTRVITGTS
jgi:uncharacterized protein (DUF885 family)